jgi:hypothetical protein
MCDMMQINENGEVDPDWHAERIRRDGYNPKEVSVPEIGFPS